MTFFSTIKDRRQRGPVDAALVLRDYSATAVSSTTSETGIAFYPRAHDTFKVAVTHAAVSSYVATSAEWTITVGVSDVVGGTYTQIGKSLVLTGTASEYEIPLSGAEAAVVDSDCVFIRVTATKTGLPGTLTYGAWIVPG